MRTNRTLCTVLAALVLSGCDSATEPDHTSLLLRTIRAEQTWLDHGPPLYMMVQQRSCECTIEMTGPVRMGVERTGTSESILTMVYESSGEPVPPTYVDSFQSVSGLFTRIREAVRAGAAEISVTFHPTLGYPTSIGIDYHATMVDDEVLYRVVSLEPIPVAPLNTRGD